MPINTPYSDPVYRDPLYSSPVVGGVPIVEQLAQWHRDAVESITVDNGAFQTLIVSREGQIESEGNRIRDLTTICSMSEVTEYDTPSVECYRWRQGFDARVYLTNSVKTGLDEDTRIAQVIADIHRLIAAELLAPSQTDQGARYCNGLAYDIVPLAWSIGKDPKFSSTCVIVPMLISFEVSKLDPCSQ